jgi:hypothetical protein
LTRKNNFQYKIGLSFQLSEGKLNKKEVKPSTIIIILGTKAKKSYLSLATGF